MGAQDVAGLVSALVSIDSVNPDLVPGGAGEGEVASYVAGWMREAGLEVEIAEAAPGRPTVVGIARGSGGGRSLMLNGHLDTVGVEGMERPFEPVVRDGRLYARGGYDMKAGVAACMLAAKRLASEQLAGDVIVTAVADEEYASIGTQAVLKRWSADGAIITEPTSLRVCVAHKGFVWADLETTGRAAHGSRPAEGVDAITRMAPALARLATLQTELDGRAGHELVGPGSVHASLIDGGQELSSYPARCVLSLERRTEPGEDREVVERECQALVEGIEGAELRIGLVRPPFSVDPGAAVVRSVARAAESVTGRPAELYGETYWMDAALIQAAGIPTVVFGPGGEGAHSVDEWVDLASVEACADGLVVAAHEFCN
jgi:acetylornithine deacetylase/succinyl-diaminopimelate desuccinylase family protein